VKPSPVLKGLTGRLRCPHRDGRTALILAARYGGVHAVELLIAAVRPHAAPPLADPRSKANAPFAAPYARPWRHPCRTFGFTIQRRATTITRSAAVPAVVPGREGGAVRRRPALRTRGAAHVSAAPCALCRPPLPWRGRCALHSCFWKATAHGMVSIRRTLLQMARLPKKGTQGLDPARIVLSCAGCV
jgi:hypothetical protein